MCRGSPQSNAVSPPKAKVPSPGKGREDHTSPVAVHSGVSQDLHEMKL